MVYGRCLWIPWRLHTLARLRGGLSGGTIAVVGVKSTLSWSLREAAGGASAQAVDGVADAMAAPVRDSFSIGPGGLRC